MNNKSSIVALIPARCGSKRIKHKNIKLLNGHPLIAYTISAAIDSGIFDEVIVSTDSEKYKDISEHYGASVLLRPEKYARDNSPDIEWVIHILNKLKDKKREYDLFSILRPTNPFRMPETIKRALNTFLKSDGVDSLRAIEICTKHPAKMWFVENKMMKPVLEGYNNGVPWHSCQLSSLPVVYIQNASLEIARTPVIHVHNSISGKKIVPFFTEDYEGYDLNNIKDWIYAKYLIEEKTIKLPNIKKDPYKYV